MITDAYRGVLCNGRWRFAVARTGNFLDGVSLLIERFRVYLITDRCMGCTMFFLYGIHISLWIVDPVGIWCDRVAPLISLWPKKYDMIGLS